MSNSEEVNFKDFPNCAIFGAVAGSLGTLILVISFHCIYKRCCMWRNRYKMRRKLKQQRRAETVEKVLSPRISEHDEPIYESIIPVNNLEDSSNSYQNLASLPPPVPALYSNMTFSTISQESSLAETVLEVEPGDGEVAPIQPYISRYDSLVTWLKNMSTGVQE